MNRVDNIESLERRTLFNALVFAKPALLPTGPHPAEIVTADLTNNGKIDLVTANFGSSTVSVIRGNGDGTFQPQVLYEVGSAPESVTVGDLNGDGIPDIVTANEGANTVSVLMGIGDGTFAPQVTYAVGIRPEGVVVADLNGGGHLDIITVNQGSATISVLTNAGDGTFAPAIDYFAGLAPAALAVGDLNGDGRPDIVTTSPDLDGVHVLLNNGVGAFTISDSYATDETPRGVTIADINSDARPDIITANIPVHSVSVLTGIGNGTFNPESSYLGGGRPLSVAVGDVTGDGRPDIITADLNDRAVGVLRRTGLSGFAMRRAFNTQNAPTSAAIADVNGDGRNDIVTADFDSDTVSVLLNQTVFLPLDATSAVLSPSQNPVQVKNGLVLSIQVTKSAPLATAFRGVAQFFDGNTVLHVVPVSASGLAKLTVSNLSVGTHTITARYSGDSVYAGSEANVLTEVVVTPQNALTFVEPAAVKVNLPANFVPATRGVADVSIRAAGAAAAVGSVDVQLFASTHITFDSTAIPLAIQTNSQVALRLIGNQTRVVPVSFVMPGNIALGSYTIFAALVPGSGFTAAQVSAMPVATTAAYQAVLQVGAVSGQRGYLLTRTLSNGDSYTLAIKGPGTGNVSENADGGISIALLGTTAGSTLTITSTTGVTLDALVENSAIGSVVAPTTNLAGSVHLEFGVSNFTLGNATDSQLVFGGGLVKTASFANLSNVNLFSGAPIKSLNVNSYTNQPGDVITTAWIGTLHSNADFGPSLIINGGTAPGNRGLADATIGGTVGDAAWRILANVGAIQVGGVAAGWSGSIKGDIQSFLDLGDFDGQFAAHRIGNFQVNGNVLDAAILAGADFGNDGRLGGGDDAYAAGVLTTLTVNGSVTNTTIAAGLKPVGNVLLAPGATLLPRSAINAISVQGAVDPGTRFLANSLPRLATIAGIDVSPANDPRFVI